MSIDYQTVLLSATDNTITEYSILNNVTIINHQAFSECSNLTSITIPKSVTYIGSFAFTHCSSLTSITIPDSVTWLGFKPFIYCPNLTSIILENRTLEEAQSLIGTTNYIGYTGTITYKDGTYNTVYNDPTAGSGGGTND